jgi:pimeloyl-ACP methyl ester carboxylesterase
MIKPPPSPDDTAAVLAHRAAFFRLIEGPGHRQPDAELDAFLRADYARAYRPEGTARQLVAVATDRDRSPLLGGLRLPARVVHGRDDPLLPVGAGRDLVRRIPGASLDVIDGMGHDLPQPLFARFADNIDHAAGRA